MKQFCFVIFASLLVLCLLVRAGTGSQEPANQNAQVNAPVVPKTQRKPRSEVRRRGLKYHYKRSGKSAGRGGKRFGKNMARGKPIKGGRELGKGMGGFGKHLGKGTAKVGKKIIGR